MIEQTYRVAVVDAAGAQDSRDVLVRLAGTNDAPVVEAVALLAESDGGPIDGAFAGDDVDSDDDAASLIYEITDAPADGLVINNGDGTFSFDPRGDFSDLAEGETRDVTVGYRAIDSNGAVSEDNWITVTVRGAGTTDPTLPLANPDTNAGDPVTEAGIDPATGAPAGDATLDAPLVVAMPPLEAETALAPDLEMVSVEEELIATADLGFVLPAVESAELVELGAQLDTGIAGALHAAIDSIQSNAAGGPLAESVVSVLQSLAARLDEPDNAVLGWLDDLLAGDGIGPVAGLTGLDGGAAYTLQDFMTEQPLLPAVITADDDLLVS